MKRPNPAGMLMAGSVFALLAQTTLAIGPEPMGPATPTPPAATRTETQLDTTAQSAVLLMREAITPHEDGRHNIMLLSLRHLREPGLEPLFTYLADQPSPVLKLHGIMGLAESSPEDGINLMRVASIDRPEVQAMLVGAALDSNMLTNAEAKQLIAWPGLDDGVKVAASLQLVRDGVFHDVELLRRATQSRSVGRAAVAGIMLLQLGDPQGEITLGKIDRSNAPLRDAARHLALQSAMRFEFDKAGPWALKVSSEKDLENRLLMTALEAALRFETPGATQRWLELYSTTQDEARRMRLALVALRVSPWAEPRLYEPLRRSQDELTRSIGRAGRAVARKRDVTESLVPLIQSNHGLATDWVLDYAEQHASVEQATEVLVTVILAQSQSKQPLATDPRREQRVETVVRATQQLSQRAPVEASRILPDLMQRRDMPAEFVRAMLLGLMRSSHENAHLAVTEVKPFSDLRADSLRIVLLAKHDQPLSQREMDDLRVMVRGGGSMQASLRLQAAWTYLRLTNQSEQALRQVLEG